MEKFLKFGFTLSIISLVLVMAFNIYNDYILPKIYNSRTNGTLVSDEKIIDLCDKALIKYITNIRDNNKSIKYFIPSISRSKSKTNVFVDTLNNTIAIKKDKVYNISKNIYMIEYTVFNLEPKMYKVIIKFSPRKNNYVILYDELYENGKGV